MKKIACVGRMEQEPSICCFCEVRGHAQEGPLDGSVGSSNDTRSRFVPLLTIMIGMMLQEERDSLVCIWLASSLSKVMT